MKIRTLAATLLSTTLLSTGLLAAPANAAPEPGNRSLAAVLTADRNQFDRNPFDYDVVTEAVLAVIDAKPGSPVALLADGDTALTAFLPNDLSFALLAKELTGQRQRSEQQTFETVASVGIDTVEQILLYHVVPGATIDKRTALSSDGAALTTAQGGDIRVDVLSRGLGLVKLRDNDPNASDPLLDPFRLDLNKGNKQIAHGIFLVLRPIDL